MSLLHPIRDRCAAARREGYERGVAEAVAHLRESARGLRDTPGSRHRRSALGKAANELDAGLDRAFDRAISRASRSPHSPTTDTTQETQ